MASVRRPYHGSSLALLRHQEQSETFHPVLRIRVVVVVGILRTVVVAVVAEAVVGQVVCDPYVARCDVQVGPLDEVLEQVQPSAEEVVRQRDDEEARQWELEVLHGRCGEQVLWEAREALPWYV